MKIAFYGNEIAQKGNCGVKTYSLEIIRSLLKVDGRNEYFIYSQRDISKEIQSDRARLVVKGGKAKFWAFSVFSRALAKDRPDVVFMPIQTLPFFIFGKYKPKTVVTVHDVAFLLFPSQFTFIKRKLLQFHTWRVVRSADKIIVPSETTKNDILRFYQINKDKIVVIPHGYSEKLLKIAKKRDEEVKKLTSGSPYVLFVGTVQPRKNIARLAEAFAGVKSGGQYPDLKLVVAGGKGWMYEQIMAEIRKNAYFEDMIFTGAVDDDFLADLYANAMVFALPSLYEGFGLPVLEAMSFGLPVICGDNSSLREIAGKAGILVDASSAGDIADKLKILLSSRKLREELSVRGLDRVKDFTWEKSAQKTLEVLESIK